MVVNSRSRFISRAITLYIASATAWILLSDDLLRFATDADTGIALATAKGLFFVCASAVALYFALRAVPAPHTATARFEAALQAPAAPAPHRLLPYGCAAAVMLATIAMWRHLPGAAGLEYTTLVLLMPGMIGCAAFGGFGPGLLSTGMAALAAAGVGTRQETHALQLAFLVLSGVLVSALCARLRTALRETELQRGMLDSIVSGTTDAIFVKDTAGRYVFVNAAAARHLGRTPADMIGRDDTELFPAEAAARLHAGDGAVMAECKLHTVEEQLTMPDGGTKVFLTTKGPVTDSGGQVLGLFGIAHDITERMRAEHALHVSQERLQTVIDATCDGVWDWNLRDETLFRTDSISRLTGIAPGGGALDNLMRSVHPDDAAPLREHLHNHRRGLLPEVDIDFRIVHTSGAVAWVKVRGKVVERQPDGTALRMAGTIADITERKQFELMQREAATVFASSHEGIMVVDASLHIARVNPAFERITGYTAAEVIGGQPALLASGRHNKAFYRDLWQAVLNNGFWRGEMWNKRKNGQVYPELLTITAVRDQHNAAEHYIGVFSDISHIKAHQAELDHIANFDPLTGLPNRRLLADRLDHAIVRTNRTGGSLAVCLLDLDGFKDINQRWGQATGDRLLVQIARALSAVIRADDTLARLGGDEFVLLMSNVGTPEECVQALDRVLAAIRAPLDLGCTVARISASIGVARYPDDHGDADALLRHADQAMYQAKENGRDRYQLFDPESDRLAQQHHLALQGLRLAHQRGEFTLHYQPKVDLRSDAVVGAEALIRWQHPVRGLVPPAEFLGHLTGTPLELEVGAWVIDTALAQVAAWRAGGLHLPVSVNVSAGQLLAPGFSAALAAALARQPTISASDLQLEILESTAIEDLEQAMLVLAACRDLGVQFALDDFGTGYSSLTYLRKLPVDTLKVDQSFVRTMLDDRNDYGIVSGVIRLAHALERDVVAEGVETAAHCNALRALGCEVAQGYGIARPMAPERLVAWCAARRTAPASPAVARNVTTRDSGLAHCGAARQAGAG